MEILSVKWNNLFRQMKKTKSPAISPIYGKEWQALLGRLITSMLSLSVYKISSSAIEAYFDWLADSTISIFT